MKRFRISAASFTIQNFRLFFRMLFYLLRIETILLVMPYSAVSKRLFEKRALMKDPPPRPQILIRKSIKILELVCRLAFWKPNCVRRSVILRDSLMKDGIEAEIKVGMKKSNGGFEAHAWVESCGIEIFKYDDYKALHIIDEENK